RAGSSHSGTSTSSTSGSRRSMSEVAAPELAVGDLPRRRRRPLARFVARRIAAGVATLFVVSMLLFAGTSILPGDVASAVLGRDSTPAGLAQLRQELHLNR